MNEANGDVPQGWAEAPVGELCTLVNGRAFKPTEWSREGLPIIRIQNLNNPTASFNYFNGALDPKHRVSPGELLFAWSGTPGTSFGAHVWSGPPAALNQHIFRVLYDGQVIDKQYFRLALNSRLAEMIGQAQGGVGLAHITKGKFESTKIWLPPLPEQHRIAAKIEELQARSRTARGALEAIPPLLEKFRQSALAAAFRGDLTAEWRAQNPDVEPGPVLLKRIRSERRTRWENTELEKMRARGRLPKDAGWRQRYVEAEAADPSDFPDLPSGWRWTHMGEIFEVDVGATPNRKNPNYWGGGIPWVSSGEVAFCRISSARETISQLGLENSSTRIHPPGTVLVGMIGEGRTRGQAAILDIPAANNQNAAAIRVSETAVPPEFVYWYLVMRYAVTRRAGSGNNQPALNKSRVQAIEFPLPPMEEQRLIVQRLEMLARYGNAIGAQLREAGSLIDQFDQSVLAKSFRGELVPQDPNDEPASVLLDRIRQRRAEREPVRRRRP